MVSQLDMIIDGTHIAQSIDAQVRERLSAVSRVPDLRIITCAPTFATRRFLALKQARARALRVTLTVQECAPESSTDDVIEAVQEACAEADAIVVQLPLPTQIDLSRVLAVIPADADVDVMGTEAQQRFMAGMSPVLPPVVGAIAEIITQNHCDIAGKNVVVVGMGRLVGAPSAIWFTQQGAHVQTINRQTADIAQYTRGADILVLGAGVPGLITPEMVHDGVIIFDAGSSEDTGKLVGDADPACAKKATLFTPVPGGIGPITVSLIFRNLLVLMEGRVP